MKNPVTVLQNSSSDGSCICVAATYIEDHPALHPAKDGRWSIHRSTRVIEVPSQVSVKGPQKYQKEADETDRPSTETLQSATSGSQPITVTWD